MTTFVKYVLAVFCCILFTVLNWYCQTPSRKSMEETARARTAYAALTDTAEYVGMNTCKGCHPQVHASFIHTGMGMSFDKASRLKSAADFSSGNTVYDSYKNMNYHSFWKNDSLFFREFRLSSKDTVYSRSEPIKFIVGSGQHTNSHMWESNHYVFQAPMTFYTQKQRWDLPPGFENGQNSRFNRIIGLECMSCHNAYPDFVLGSENKYNKVYSGIDCERCHGPGSVHVREKSMGILIDTSKQIDYSIVNPSKLPIDLQFDVCQRCHIQGNAVLNDGRSFFDFKPGMKLSEVMNVFMPVYSGNDNEHIMASHAERLKMSKCFVRTREQMKKSGRADKNELKPYKDGLTCITCHNPHVSVKSQDKQFFNKACMKCHDGKNEGFCADGESITSHLGNAANCVSCHMPVHGTLDIPHVSVHDHRIAIPAKREDVHKVKKFIGINCINNPDPPPTARAQAYINYVEKFGMDKSLLDSALAILNLAGESGIEMQFHMFIHVYYLKGQYENVIAIVNKMPGINEKINRKSYDNKDAWTSYRIAEAFLNTGNHKQAISWFANAFKLAPLHPDFGNKYANALASMGRYKEAREIFSGLVTEHPYFAPALCNLGYLVLLQDGNFQLAHHYFDKALLLEPDYELAILNKALAFMHEGRNHDAKAMLIQALKNNPGSVSLKEGLKKLNTL